MWVYILCAGLAYFLYYNLVARRKGFPPGPTPWPVVGNVLQLDQTDMTKTFSDWGKKYNGFFTVWMPTPVVFITDFDLMKETIIKFGDAFSGRPDLVSVKITQKGKYGLLFSDGQLWRDQRRFALHVLRDFGFGRNIMQEKVMVECRRLVEWFRQDSHSPFDPTHNIEVAVGSIINSMLYGYAYEKDDEKFRNLKHKLDESLRFFTSPGVLLVESFPWLNHLRSYLPLGIEEMVDNFCDILDFLQSEIEQRKRSADLTEEPTDFVTAYLKEMNRRKSAGENTSGFDDWQLVVTISDLWGAGMETTVTTLRWAIAFMLKYPDIQEKVHQEISDKVGLEYEVTYEDRARLSYVQATINEIQRCGNILPLNLQREVTQDTTVRGYLLKKGTWVVPAISSVLTDPAYFKDPEKFDPARFLENGELIKSEQLVPFSVGKRNCLGESLARMELFLIFTTLMQKFQVLPDDGVQPTVRRLPGSISTVEKYKVIVKARI